MEKFVERLEEDLNESSELIPTVTVSRSDLENLLWAYENTKKKAAAGTATEDRINIFNMNLTIDPQCQCEQVAQTLSDLHSKHRMASS